MKLVIDTNVIISAFLWQGAPHRLIELATEGSISLFTSPALLEELNDVLHRPRLARAVNAAGGADYLFQRFHALAHAVRPEQFSEQICRDADDDAVLACALAAQASMIVTGDKDLLVLHPFRQIQILIVAEALQKIATPH